MGVEQHAQPAEVSLTREEVIKLHDECGNLKFLEHINLSNTDKCTEQSPAYIYFMRGLQCSRDPRLAYHFWANFGRNQFHLFTGQPKDEQIRATIVLYAPDLDDLERSLEAVRAELKDTKFAVERVNRGGASTIDYPREKWHEIFEFDSYDHLKTRDPYGNVIRIFTTPRNYWSIYKSLGKLVPVTDGVEGKPQGLPFLYYPARPGIARGIARFFEHYIGAKTTVIDKPDGLVRTSVWCGPLQAIVFDELESERDSKGEYDGHHVCFHIDQFKEKFDLAHNESMNWNNLLFFDRCDTWAEANRDQQYRILHLIDPVDKSFLMSFEMEIRSAQHFRYLIHRADVTDEQEAANEVLRKKNL
jgi:hypothetical protein